VPPLSNSRNVPPTVNDTNSNVKVKTVRKP
jgi:hypothetical protein